MPHDEHNERLARIETKMDTALVQLGHINGRVRTAEEDICDIQAKCAVHDGMTVWQSTDGIALDGWRAGVDADIKSLRESRVSAASRSGTIRENATLIVVLTTLAMSFYGLVLARETAHQRVPEPAAQHQIR